MNDTLYNWIRKIENERIQFMAVFSSYLKDYTISIDDRWDAFTEAPFYVKCEELYTPAWIPMHLLTDGRYGRYGRYVRGSPICTLAFIENLIEDDVPPARIEFFKEQILQNNLGTFIYDW